MGIHFTRSGDLEKNPTDTKVTFKMVFSPNSRIKFPSIPYLDISPGIGPKAAVLPCRAFIDVPLVLTIKMDGSNAQLRNRKDGPALVAARNAVVASHPSFNRLKARGPGLIWKSSPCHHVFGEWLYAKHTIHYRGPLALSDYFMIFAVYQSCIDRWASQDYVSRTAKDMGVPTVPVIGKYRFGTEREAKATIAETAEKAIHQGHEGVVVWAEEAFPMEAFGRCVAKYVRPNHVQTDEHWRHKAIVPNELIEPEKREEQAAT